MSAAEKLDERNDVMLALADTDEKLKALFTEGGSYRVVAECRELLDIRAELADTLIAMGGQPGPAPIQLPEPAVVA
jgi:hypothetical protein